MSLELNLETAIPCGLLINEIITNSCKHAFYDRSLGQIKINMSSNGVLHQLDISDNGVGLSENFDWENSTSLGLRLVNLLSMQLDARLERQKLSKGTGFRLSFTELEYSNRI
jgi:two-component sensor histidine kinase